MKPYKLCLVLSLMTGCTRTLSGYEQTLDSWGSTKEYVEVLQSWVHKDAKLLRTKWGNPTKVTSLPDGNKSYHYDFYKEIAHRTVIDRSYYTYTDIYIYRCNTTFKINSKNKIVGWSIAGNACKA